MSVLTFLSDLLSSKTGILASPLTLSTNTAVDHSHCRPDTVKYNCLLDLRGQSPTRQKGNLLFISISATFARTELTAK